MRVKIPISKSKSNPVSMIKFTASERLALIKTDNLLTCKAQLSYNGIIYFLNTVKLIFGSAVTSNSSAVQ